MRPKTIRLFSRAAMLLLMMLLTATTAWAAITGSGTQQDPYIIHNASDWNTAGQDTKYYYNSGNHVYIELDADIDFNKGAFKRFGQDPNSSSPGSCYIHFDGKGHTIQNIIMDKGSNNFAAPFGNLATGSTISNLTVANSNFTADRWVAGITCKNSGTITNCHVESTVTLTANKTSTSEYCGGITAQNGGNTSSGTDIGTITNCTVGAKFVLVNRQNEAHFGGIVGRNRGASPVSGCLCYSTDVTSNLNYFKILIGSSYGSDNVVTNNYYRPVGNYGHGAPDASTTLVRAVSGIPSGVTSPHLCVSHGGYGYFPANSTITLSAPAHKAFNNDFSVSGTGSSYTLSSNKTSATVTIGSADVTINASLRNFTYTVTFNGNGSTSGSMSSMDFEYSVAKNLTANGFTRTGYTFAGWATSENGDVVYSDQQSVNNLSDTDGGTVTLYAKWTPITYSVAFDGNGSTGGSMDAQSFTYDTAKNLTANGFTRTGYTFAGWATSENGDVVYTNQQSVNNLTTTDGGTVTLYAKWTPITYSVAFDGNGSTGGSMDAQSFTYDTAKNLTANGFTRTGCTFAGWATSENGDVVYSDQQSVNNLSDTDGGTVTLYANWDVPYIDADGNPQTCTNFTELTSGTNVSYLSAGWYVVTEDVSYSSWFHCGSGDIHLILCDGAKMTVESSSAIVMGNGSLTIYAQSTGSSMGKLEATASSTSGIHATGNITICGGNITATGNSSKADIYALNNFIIHSGQVSASGNWGIQANHGTITLGLRNATDYITANSFYTSYGTVNIADGQTLIDGTAAYTGNNVSIPDGNKTLQLPVAVTLADGITATTGIVDIDDDYYAKAGATVTVSTSGATAPQGYTLSGITVSPTADVTDNGNGSYSFIMPAEDATVSLALAPIDWATVSSGNDVYDPYIIYNKDQLLLLAYRVNGTHGETDNTYEGKYFQLGADIKFTYDPNEGKDDYAENYEAIGAGGFLFRGAFDGKGHTISGIRIRKTGTSTADSYQGLFGYITGYVCNIHLTDARIQGHNHVGGIVGYTSGGDVGFTDVTDSYITANGNYGTICGNGANVTGRLDHNYYHHCTVNGTVNATDVGCNGADIISEDAAIPLPVLSDTEDNTAAIASLSTRQPKYFTVMLEGRTLSKNGDWNTLCLPFYLSARQIAASSLAGATIKELNATTSNLNNGTLTLNFTDATDIEPGKPYIVRWGTPENNPGGTIVNPIFQEVTIDATAPTPVEFAIANSTDKCQFVGQFSPFSIVESGATGSDQGNKNEIILMSTGNRIGYSQNPRTLKCFRCHFYVPANSGEFQARSFVLDFGDNEQTTEINEELRMKNEEFATATEWYTLDGRKLDGKPTAKGLYIVNGKKVLLP